MISVGKRSQTHREREPGSRNYKLAVTLSIAARSSEKWMRLVPAEYALRRVSLLIGTLSALAARR